MKKLFTNLTLAVGLSVVSLTQLRAQETQIKFFGQPEFIYQSIKSSNYNPGISPTVNPLTGTIVADNVKHDTSNTNFNTGKQVLFVTSQLSDKISVLSENSAYFSNGNFQFEIERLLLRYNIKDYFSVRVGRMFVPLGYWNNKYNLGLVLQPTIQRPLVIRNSSDGGVLEIKDNGAQIEGDNISKLRFSYRLLFSNGIGFNGSNNKGNNSIATTVSIGIEPIEGLKIIASARRATLFKGTPTLTGLTPDNGVQTLSNIAVAYMNPEKKPEFIAELYNSRQDYKAMGKSNSYGYFAYAGYKVTNKVVPYAQYSYAQAGTNTKSDLYYAGLNGILASVSETILGIRYKISSNFVYKLEYVNTVHNYTYQNNVFALPIGPGASAPLVNGDIKGYSKTNMVRMQFAFAF
jgi:hypothetical protein